MEEKNKYGEEYFEKRLLYKSKENSKRNSKRLSEILKYKKSGKLFEIACAEGEFLVLAKKYFDVEGIDISDYAVSIAKKELGKKVSVKDIVKIKLPKNKYDVIVAFNILEHIKEPRKVINTIQKSLKKKGLFIGTVPNNSGIIGRCFTLLVNHLDKTHCSTFHPKKWNKLFSDSGLKLIKVFGEIPISRNRSYYIKNKAWRHMSGNMVFIYSKK